MNLLRLLVVLLFLASGPVLAQKQWTLNDCINYAMENNIQVLQSEVDVGIAEQDQRQAKSAYLPSLNGFATNNYNFGQRIDPFTNQFASTRVRSNSFSLNASVDLFRGFQVTNRAKQSELDVLASKYNSDRVKNDLALNIANAYLQIVLNQELKNIAENQVAISKRQVKQMELLVQAGSVPEGDKLSAESQLAQDEMSLTTANNQLNLSLLRLRQLLQLKPTESFEIAPVNFEIPETERIESPDRIYSQSVKVMPGIKSAEYALLSAEKGISIAKGTASPTLTLGASYGTGYSGASQEVIGTEFAGQVQIGQTANGVAVLTDRFNTNTRVIPFSDQLENNLNQTVGLSLSIPIFNNFSSQTSIGRARLQAENASYQLEQAKNDLTNDIQTAHADAVASLADYRANQKAVNAMEVSFRYSQQRFEAGLMNVLDFNIEKNNLAQAQSQLQQAKFNYLFRIKVLDFFQGKSLTL